MVGIGVVGAGYWGPNLVRNFAALSGVQMIAVADRDRGRLEHIGALFPGVDRVERIEEIPGPEQYPAAGFEIKP